MADKQYNVPAPTDVMRITCLHCDKQLEVGRRTQSVTCKFCHKPLSLSDFPVKQYLSRRNVETLGIVTVEKKGDLVVTDLVNCGGAVIRGKVKGDIKSRGPVLVGPEAEIKGDITAPTIAIGPGAILNGHYEIGTVITSENSKAPLP